MNRRGVHRARRAVGACPMDLARTNWAMCRDTVARSLIEVNVRPKRQCGRVQLREMRKLGNADRIRARLMCITRESATLHAVHGLHRLKVRRELRPAVNGRLRLMALSMRGAERADQRTAGAYGARLGHGSSHWRLRRWWGLSCAGLCSNWCASKVRQ